MAAAVDSWSSQTIGDISTLKPFFERTAPPNVVLAMCISWLG